MIRLLRSASAAVGLACLGSACAGASDSGHVLVEAPAGPVRGVTQDGLEIFKGIPFAAPPVGEARWVPPAAMPAWDEAYDATEFGPGCMQPGWVSQSIYTDTLPRLSEDCLNLNIWAPAEASGAPVVVWIHGGALVRGARLCRYGAFDLRAEAIEHGCDHSARRPRTCSEGPWGRSELVDPWTPGFPASSAGAGKPGSDK